MDALIGICQLFAAKRFPEMEIQALNSASRNNENPYQGVFRREFEDDVNEN